ncbi:hypothetical protein [Streptomyces brasiliensis]|uniref:SMP-30/Gluconolactonase/LRE-like region domain-containing protein n=1 Tax=Streptomyces brasiliensis TaxID=1954 RepID=A0A917KTJ7_9ACTN|nr:hypothetical protein [Streptomyces brasiliensis]GGJ27164.1 hypothetical protein GCM10010121_042970 [Streptomyces brasiliensis]
MSRLPRLAGVTTAAVALGVLASAPALSVEPPVSDPRVVARFDLAGRQTPDNITLERDGSADVTLAYARQVAHVTQDGRQRILATLPPEANPRTPLVGDAVVLGIVAAHDGTLFVTYATGTAKTGVWRIGPGGGRKQIAQLPADGLPNGLALDERRGLLYVADSVLGTVWRIPRQGGKPSAWARAAALEPGSGSSSGLGANGVKVHRDAVWVSNTDGGTLLRIPVRPDGDAGPVETRASGLDAIDDFAFPGPGSTVFAALVASNQVALVRPDGTHTVVLTQRDGLSSPTSVAVRGRTVYVPSAAYFTKSQPNLLLAHLRRQFSR